jgi:antitoxin component YwqK of YwqJK toxin-antitoxin module
MAVNENGIIKIFDTEYFIFNGKKEGEYKIYYNTCQKLSKCGYRIDGKLEGEYKEYWGNGKLNKSYNYKNGKKTGIYKEYYPTGKLGYTSYYELL